MEKMKVSQELIDSMAKRRQAITDNFNHHLVDILETGEKTEDSLNLALNLLIHSTSYSLAALCANVKKATNTPNESIKKTMHNATLEIAKTSTSIFNHIMIELKNAE